MNLTVYRARYALTEALRNIRHSPTLALISILTIAVSLILVGFFGHILLNAYDLLDEVGKELRVTVYLKSDATSADIENIRSKVESRPDIARIEVLTALQDRERNIQLLDEEILGGLDHNSVPGSPCIDIVLNKAQRGQQDLTEMVAWLKGLEAVDTVDEIHFSAERFQLLYALIDVFELVGLLICAVILFASIFFVFGTIKLAVYARKEEIEVMRLVGATNKFICAPFFIEGMLQGLMGSIVAVSFVWIIHMKVQSYIAIEKGLSFNLNLMPTGVILWFIFGGILLGLAGTAISVGRHLKV